MVEKDNFAYLGRCIFGDNLNLSTLRGQVSLGLLAEISRPDLFDQLTNESGVQRAPAEKHAREALAYALESLKADPQTDPRAFTEVILNVRDLTVLVFKNPASGSTVSLKSVLAGKHQVLDVFVRLSVLNYSPSQSSSQIQISRVDGNHRLLHAAKMIDAGSKSEEFPTVPFAIFLGLSINQERKIFADINGNHKNMSGSLMRHHQSTELNFDPVANVDALAKWIANQLTRQGRIFHSMVNLGGSLQGYRAVFGTNPPLTLVGVSNAVREFLIGGAHLRNLNTNDPDFLVHAFDDFFKCARIVWPETFENYHQYAMLKAIGLGGFSRLAGTVNSNLEHTKANYSNTEILKLLNAVKDSGFSLDRWHWQGMSSGAGMKHFYSELRRSLENTGLENLTAPRLAVLE